MLFGIGGFWSPKLRYPAWTKKCVQTLVSVSVLKHSGEPARNLIFWSPGDCLRWTPRACMYVCLNPSSEYVCLKPSSVCLKPSSVYVWRPQACMFERVCLSVYVCMPQTYIHKPNIHTQLVDLPYRRAFQKALERVCMFKNPLPVMDFKHTYTLRTQHYS